MSTQRHTLRKRLSRQLRSERGIALLMVLVTVAVLTAVVAEFVYQTRVEVQMAANVRDRVKAYYLARSATNVARLVVYLQGRIDMFMKNMPIPKEIKDAGMMGTIKLYQIFPIESDLAKALTSGEIGDTFGMKGLNLGDKRGFGEFDGSFHASIEDESAKINANAFNGFDANIAFAIAQIVTLIGDKRYAPMFEGADADGQYNTPDDIVEALWDWVDPNTTTFKINFDAVLTNPFSLPASMLGTPGVASEDSRYDMLKDPYKTKNLPFFTLDELYLIRGVSDNFMREFGDKFTVYTDPNSFINLSSVNDPATMFALLCMQPVNKVLCSEPGAPKVMDALALFFERLNQMRATSIFMPDTNNIGTFFELSTNVKFEKAFLKNSGSSSKIYRVQAQGEVGETTVTIRTVVRNSDLGGQDIMYWRVM
jgi:general secretion pathway protein K